jgi:glutathione S-transferase
LRLYDYGASGNCYKVRLLLSLLGREYERVPVDIFDGGTLTAGYAQLNPARETPVLHTDDGAVVTQSNAILWYLAAGVPTCRPRGSRRPRSWRGCASSRSA